MNATTAHQPTTAAAPPTKQKAMPGITLATLACLPVAGGLLIVQVLPQMQSAFTGEAHARLMVSVMVTIPALMIAVTSWLSGLLGDRVKSRKNLLLLALGLYGVFALAPLALTNLPAIIATRAGLGIIEGVILTCSTALIGALYAGEMSAKYLSLQTSLTSIGAVIFALLGGALGEFGWRAPFWVYIIGFLCIPLVARFVPSRAAAKPGEAYPNNAKAATAAGEGKMPWLALSIVCVTTLILSLCFYIPQLQTPFLLNAVGVHASGMIGVVSALANAAMVLGTLFFALERRIGLRWTTPLCFLGVTAGLAIMSQSTSVIPLCAGIFLASFGTGLGMPTLLIAAMRISPPTRSGLGSGIWQSNFWMGQFLSPILVLGITAWTGTLPHAIAACAGAAAVFLILLLLLGGRLAKI